MFVIPLNHASKLSFVLLCNMHFLFFTQIGRPSLYLIWTTFWALYFPAWLGLDWYWYSVKPESIKKYWVVFMTNLAFLVLCLAVLTEWMVAVYTHCVNRNIINGKWFSQCIFSFVVFNSFAANVADRRLGTPP